MRLTLQEVTTHHSMWTDRHKGQEGKAACFCVTALNKEILHTMEYFAKSYTEWCKYIRKGINLLSGPTTKSPSVHTQERASPTQPAQPAGEWEAASLIQLTEDFTDTAQTLHEEADYAPLTNCMDRAQWSATHHVQLWTFSSHLLCISASMPSTTCWPCIYMAAVGIL